MSIENFNSVLGKFRKEALSERDKGFKFEKLMQSYLKTTSLYTNLFKEVWMWNEFPSRAEFGKNDVGIDLVALTYDDEFWAIQCKCYQSNTYIDKKEVDSFLSTSGKHFTNSDTSEQVSFSNRLWISTTNNWSQTAENTLHNQNPPVSRLSLTDLENDEVDWLKLENGIFGENARVEQKKPFEHQIEALKKSHEYLKTNDRGKLIMACGTGKTFTSLKLAEQETNNKGLVLFLVPSIALLGQTLREWSAQASEPINAICICSDGKVSQKVNQNDDETFSTVNLALPASTDVHSICKQLQHSLAKDGMTVVFSTYQSIDVISKAQQYYLKNFIQEDEIFENEIENTKGIFDLIICDEAHRTTGVTIAGQDESAFVKVHDNNFIKARKRIYMTATPRLYNDETKSKANEADAILCSMDDMAIYGDEIYRIGFGEAVDRDLLSDYKVLVLTVGDKDISPSLQRIISGEDGTITADDASKMVGCINALSKKLLGDAAIIKDTDPEPMRRAVAFCQNIKVSKATVQIFNECEPAYFEDKTEEEKAQMVFVNADHIDGSMSAPTRDEKLSWLKATPDNNKECRMLTNVRCLSEGVDVPSLDAVLFLSARNSQVDVVQSVGRVMRKAEGKKYGYIIIPVVVPEGVDASEALDKNPRFNVVWTVLNALRAHDDRFNATVNQIELNKRKPAQILIGGINNGSGADGDGTDPSNAKSPMAEQLALQFETLQSTFYAKMVQKVGNKRYWEQWAKDIASIAEEHIARIQRLIKEDGKHKKAFEEFLKGLRKNINPSVSEQEAIEMLSQHMITKPVFEALFENYSFVQNNAISKSMQKVMDLLDDKVSEEENEKLQKFYDSVRRRVEGIDNGEGKQKVIVELYDKFFKSAFPKVVEKLGIVYTPVEVVDFIVHSVGYILKKEFDRSLSDENVHVLDPFTGTGTFIARLLQSGLIKKEDLERKYTKELHANEIVLLAYYIASINIENIYHDLSTDGDNYRAFDGICLTDTFQLGEDDAIEKMYSEMFPQNSKRVIEQKKTPLRVIIGNPPYSVGQKSVNDNAQNQEYPVLENRIASTYAINSNANLKNALYDSYIKAFRWSSDRLDKKNGGVIAFVTNGAWIDGNAMDGFRKCIETEFTSIYVFNLRGNQRTSGELSRKEGGKIFGSGSRTPIAITLLVKNPQSTNEKATIHYHDIGDYLSQQDKLGIIKDFKSINNPSMQWKTLEPNEHGDWINLRSDAFDTFIQLGDKDDKKAKTFFNSIYSRGFATSRDAWVYNSSKQALIQNIQKTTQYYNETCHLIKKNNNSVEPILKSRMDKTQITWTDTLLRDVQRNIEYEFKDKYVCEAVYRPFFKQYFYYDKKLIHRTYQFPKLYTLNEHKNLTICVSGVGASKDFSALMTNLPTDLQVQFNGQCFPLYWYEDNANDLLDLFKDTTTDRYIRRDGVSDFILKEARTKYGHKTTKEDVFYYVYGLLHSPDYRTAFEADLKKMLPRLPLVDKADDFWAFSKAGRELADLHLNYETVEPYKGIIPIFGAGNRVDYRVEKMRFGKNGKETNKSVIYYNSQIRIDNIPLEAYDYVVNGKSAIEWIMERYAVTINKDSQIKNDPNDWSTEHNDEKYIYNLLLRVITVSVETVKIVNGLPKLEF